MYRSALLVALVPPEAATVTSTVPAGPAGAGTVIDVVELTVTGVAAVVPKSTAVTPVKLVPIMVTEFPPAGSPELGLTELTVGMVETM